MSLVNYLDLIVIYFAMPGLSSNSLAGTLGYMKRFGVTDHLDELASADLFGSTVRAFVCEPNSVWVFKNKNPLF